jgi:hypothetical protein
MAVSQRREVEARRAPALAALREFPRVTLTESPWGKETKARGTKAQGYAYERKVGKVLTKICDEAGWKLWDHQWFKCSQGNKVEYFQPDFIIERPSETGVVLEAKLTWVDTTLQLNKYLEYLKIFGIICFPATVVRNLTSAVLTDLVVDDFAKIKAGAIWHLWV